ncbi:secretin N-terminal domain-containing protein [Gloeobacter morelensis]|uniref:Secretin and TonB N-terminal domain-containing protein n=1 Tax=Gloeobacter morelensis MG652769 TaxID=2781736 RepID=A0ABY3PLZ1_9CYAN|nr:secretin N-terminal domain-containing protein [Gloeobacter morelensis]UFP94688.1 secretin and TonB N-terminal domain-containing protein [Gloeobacter morelensis MG652769]
MHGSKSWCVSLALLLGVGAAAAEEPLPRLRTRAVAPPAGDIAGEEIPLGRPVELGSGERVTLALKDAPVREVLQILARRAGCNVLFGEGVSGQRVSMDVRGETLDDTFNLVLHLHNLKARRTGNTILVGGEMAHNLPQTRMRTFRLNQADVQQAAGVLRGLGAQVGSTNLGSTQPGAATTNPDPASTSGPLRGELFVTVDARTNSLVAVGSPRALQIAQVQLAQLDVRQRQVMIDVKLVDVNLNNVSDLGFRLGGSAGNFQLGTVGGTADLDALYPAAVGLTGGGPGNSLIFNTLGALASAMALRLDTAIQEGSARVLASPQLLVASGASFSKPTAARVEITDDVVVGATITTDRETGQSTTTVKVDKVGVSLEIAVYHVDDNGFVDVSLKPQVSSINDIQRDAAGNVVTLLTRRNLDIQRLRLRDGETFVIGGVLREIDRQLVQKVPLLGDLPVLGALFRFQSNQHERREVALMVTPHILNESVHEAAPLR